MPTSFLENHHLRRLTTSLPRSDPTTPHRSTPPVVSREEGMLHHASEGEIQVVPHSLYPPSSTYLLPASTAGSPDDDTTASRGRRPPPAPVQFVRCARAVRSACACNSRRAKFWPAQIVRRDPGGSPLPPTFCRRAPQAARTTTPQRAEEASTPNPRAVRVVRPCGAERVCVQSAKHNRGRREPHKEGNSSGAHSSAPWQGPPGEIQQAL